MERRAAAAASAAAAGAAAAPPREEPAGVADEAALLEAFLSVPALSRGWAFPAADGGDGVRVALQLSQRHLPANRQRKFLQQLELSEAALELGAPGAGGLPAELPPDVVLVAPSPSGRRMLVAREAKGSGGPNGGGGEGVVLEVWDGPAVALELAVPKALHGSVYNDGWFGVGAAWSPDERAVAYVAEAPPAVRTPEWGVGAAAGGGGGAGAEGGEGAAAPPRAAPRGWRGVGELREDWGELNTGKAPPAVFVLDLADDARPAVRRAPAPAAASAGQPAWAPDGRALVFVSWPHAGDNFPDFPQRLGIVYCFNRPCSLFAAAWPPAEGAEGAGGAPLELTPGVGSAFSPRFAPGGRALVFLSQAAAVKAGNHNGTCALLAIDDCGAALAALRAPRGGAPPPPPARRTVLGVVHAADGAGGFPGLYCSVLPDDPFFDGGGGETWALATTQWRSQTAVVAVSLATGAVRRLSPDNGASWSLVAAAAGWALAAESSPALPWRLHAGRPAAATGGAAWTRVPAPAPRVPPAVAAALHDLETHTLALKAEGHPFEAVVIRRRGGGAGGAPPPTVLTPHGGPHSAYAAAWFAPLSFLAASGYAVVLLNYRGSTGFGEAALQSLPGRVGAADVADCLAGLDAAVAAGLADGAAAAALGGSHGGFLAAHLAGQAPGRFRAAVLRNPVCDISFMVGLSDIPDWCFVEALGAAGRRAARAAPTAADLAAMAAASPAARAADVAAPVLMMLGGRDRRVPPADGRRFLEAVRAPRRAGGAPPPETRLLLFPEDSHALDRPQTEFEQWLNAAAWLKRHVLGGGAAE